MCIAVYCFLKAFLVLFHGAKTTSPPRKLVFGLKGEEAYPAMMNTAVSGNANSGSELGVKNRNLVTNNRALFDKTERILTAG